MFDKLRGLKPGRNRRPPRNSGEVATSAVAVAGSANLGDDAAGLELDLCKLAGRRCADELTALTSAAFHDLGALYRDGLSDQQTTALDRTLATLQQIDELAIGLTTAVDTGLFRLADVMNEVCSLCAPMAVDRGIELIPLVFDDLSVAYRGDPGALRQLLVALCLGLIEQGAPGPLVLRAMLADVADETDDEPGAEVLWITLESEGGHATNASASESLPALAHLPGIADGKPSLEHTPKSGIRLSLSLTPTTPTDAPHPLPSCDQAILFHHPLDIARSALGQRLRRLRFDSREIDDLSDLNDGDKWTHSAALVLALPTGFEYPGTLIALSPVPVIVIGDSPSSIAASATLLPACIDDARLYRALTGAIHRHRLAQPPAIRAPNAAAALTGGDPELGERLLQMLIDELPTSLGSLQEAARRGDRAGLKDAIHKLKGGASYCGVPALHQVALALDQAALSAPMAQIELLLARLQTEAGALEQALANKTGLADHSNPSDESQAPT